MGNETPSVSGMIRALVLKERFTMPGPPVSHVSVQPDGKILIVGIPINEDRSYWDGFTLLKVSQDGSLDRTFGSEGMVSLTGPSLRGEGPLAIQSDGKLLIWFSGALARFTRMALLILHSVQEASY